MTLLILLPFILCSPRIALTVAGWLIRLLYVVAVLLIAFLLAQPGVMT